MLEGQGRCVSVHNGHTDNCGADIPQFQLVALLVGRLAALHRYWLSSKFLSTVRTHLGTQDFVAVTDQPLRVLPGCPGCPPGLRLPSCVSPIESLGFSDFFDQVGGRRQ